MCTLADCDMNLEFGGNILDALYNWTFCRILFCAFNLTVHFHTYCWIPNSNEMVLRFIKFELSCTK